MSCSGLELFKKGTLNPSVDKMYSIFALKVWAFPQSFRFYLPKRRVFITERVVILFSKGAVNIKNIITEDLSFFNPF